MTPIKPGREYFWKGGVGPSTIMEERYQDLIKWIEDNIEPNDWTSTGGLVTTLTFHFENEEDALAFKLKFGL